MNDDMVYAASMVGAPGFHAVCVDSKDHQKDVAKFVSGEIKRGATISRVTVDQAKEGMREYLEHRGTLKARNASAF